MALYRCWPTPRGCGGRVVRRMFRESALRPGRALHPSAASSSTQSLPRRSGMRTQLAIAARRLARHPMALTPWPRDCNTDSIDSSGVGFQTHADRPEKVAAAEERTPEAPSGGPGLGSAPLVAQNASHVVRGMANPFDNFATPAPAPSFGSPVSQLYRQQHLYF